MDSLDQLLWGNAEFLEALYKQYLADANSVAPEWANFFTTFEAGSALRSPGQTPSFLTAKGGVPKGMPRSETSPGIQIYDLVHTYREYGHLIAQIDPLGRRPKEHPFLHLGEFGFEESDLDKQVSCAGFHGPQQATVRQYLTLLRETYCGPIGVEYMDIMSKDERDWLQERMEPIRNRPNLRAEKKRQVLHQLIASDLFEETLHRMYPGGKRFSLEGGSTLITLLDEMLAESSIRGAEQIVIGMAHRGRLNVLANILDKPLEYILAEFEGRPLATAVEGYGDVKYHMGYSSDREVEGNMLHLSLAFNPSHLEIVNPIVEGTVRAKQEMLCDVHRERVVPILLHGDAAFAGQGVVAETFTLGGLAGYCTGGTVHIIVNNQVGFTTNPEESRSTQYASDIAKTVRAPVFHVNADHPEAVALAARLAVGYRQQFHRDVVVDLVCYRRHGHNELDDPTYTQPDMMQLIGAHKPTWRIYGNKLILAKVVSESDIQEMVTKVREKMHAARDKAKQMSRQVMQSLGGRWKGIKSASKTPTKVTTSVPRDKLENIARAFIQTPPGFCWHRRLEKQMQKRAAMVLEPQKQIDWGCGEALALGSLLLEGARVRFSGQDVGRGTFSHRHAIYSDLQTGQRYIPLNHIQKSQAKLEMINSPLSEEAVLGFEYGYASADPWTLVVWEAQFGDFVNGAQIVVDQYISTAEYKWGRMSGLVMLLPHGYEGQGPEHSSARPERFLSLCAENNLQVCNFTTPAQYFHALRRQLRQDFRRPLIVLSPKSLLRHPLAISKLEDFTDGQFEPVLDDPAVEDRRGIDRVLLCSGKIYYTLLESKKIRGVDDIAIVRIEQLYPYPSESVRTLLNQYPNLRNVVWVQEEPRNMGAWRNLLHQFQRCLPPQVTLDYAGRDSRAVTASGSIEVHRREEALLVEAAFHRDARPRIVRRTSVEGTGS